MVDYTFVRKVLKESAPDNIDKHDLLCSVLDMRNW